MLTDKNLLAMLAALVLGGIGIESARAHHSMSPHYDSSRKVSIEGMVTAFEFVNPHSFVYLDVEQEDGSLVNWYCEMQPVAVLQRRGWTEEIFAPGTRVAVEGIAARFDANGCAFVSAVTDRGIEIADRGVLSVVPEGALASTASIVSNDAPITTGIFGLWRTGGRYMPTGDLAGDLASVPSGDELPSLEAFGTPENPLGIYADYLTEQGKLAAAGYDVLSDDPALMCSGASIMRSWTEPAGISEITQQGNQIIIKHEYMDVVRRVDMSSRAHLEQIEPSMIGHSVGWFEGEDLIIDTIGFEAGVLFPHPGVLHSAQMHVVERLSVSEDGTQLIRNYLATDALYFSKPMPGKVVWNRSQGPLSRYDCVELSGNNNLSPN